MIDKYELQEKIEKLVQDYLATENILMVDLHLRRQGKKFILRILVDEHSGGITLDKCAHINNEIGKLLDAENLIQERYILEVSSPGINRLLVNKEDFSRCLNRKVRIFLNQEQASEIVGIIQLVTDTEVVLDCQGNIQNIQFANIRKAKQIVD